MDQVTEPHAFGARLRSFREARHLTKHALAQMAGTTTVSIWQWETGRRVPQYAYLMRLATALAVSAEDLQTGGHDHRCPMCGGPVGSSGLAESQNS